MYSNTAIAKDPKYWGGVTLGRISPYYKSKAFTIEFHENNL